MKNLLFFVTGAAIGSVVTWKLIEKKYKDIADEEIASVIETFKAEKPKRNKKDIIEVVDNVLEKTAKEVKKKVSKNKEKEPYIITPEQYGEYEEYKTLSLLYLADDNLIDDNDEIIKDRDAILGKDALSHFGEYEDDSVYIRDEDKLIDYEILRSEKTFSEIQKGQTN